MTEPAVAEALGALTDSATPTEVGFRGERSGRAPLTWGQRAIWHAIRRTAPNDHYFNIGRVLPLADRGRPATVAATLDALARLMERHEALRTRLVLSAADGEPSQCLADTGSLPVTVARATGLPEAAAQAEALLDELSAARFDYAAEWPLRAALVTVGDRVTHAVLVLCHLAADGHAAEVLVRDLRLLVRRGSAGRPPAATPLDLARDQHAEGGRRGAVALAHWEAGFRAAPPTMFPEPCAEPRSPRFWTGRIVSPALARAVAAVAAAHRVSGSTVLLTASAALVAAGEGHRTAAVMPIVGNRTAEALRDLVSTLSQDGLFVLDLGATGREGGAAVFTDLLPAAYRAALRAYRAAVYDPVEWDALGERLHTEYGREVHPYCCFNDMRLVERPVPEGPRPAPEELAAELAEARRRTSFGFPATQDRVACRYCLHITEEGDALAVSLTADTAYLPPEAIRGHLYAMEELIVASAAGRPPLLGGLRALLETAEGERP
ncbi:condensation domain-containing protein [Streptomyces sp. SID14515]|uniref:condensation domain-containing protein n=1 Tax=Streptomyces sp. SID14515 TaxID=2706074 RepID=UPI0013C5D540|nr:condensation domain-containing protein [Streptomyces sp. SID14515]NEB42422.1 non-ribosomal peptide synthetase condensation domain protein [Streptomyces sp. SID14515]